MKFRMLMQSHEHATPPIIVAKKYNPKIKAFYDRLLENGKPKMVALIACMRKLLTILNTMIRNGKMWNEQHQTA